MKYLVHGLFAMVLPVFTISILKDLEYPPGYSKLASILAVVILPIFVHFVLSGEVDEESWYDLIANNSIALLATLVLVLVLVLVGGSKIGFYFSAVVWMAFVLGTPAIYFAITAVEEEPNE